MSGLALALGLLAAAPARAADAVATASLEPEGYARLAFAFDRLPKASAELRNGVLVISFSEPVEVDIGPAVRALRGLVGVARLDPDRTAIRIALEKPVTLNATEAGESFFVDLMPSSWRGLPPPLPKDVIAALSREAREARALKAEDVRRRARPRDPLVVTGATHPTFRRLIFTLPDGVAVEHRRVGDRVEVTFDAALAFDVAAAKGGLPPDFPTLAATRGATTLTVSVAAPADTDVRGFREEGGFILDIDRADAPTSDEHAGAEPHASTESAHASASDAPAAPAPEPAERSHAGTSPGINPRADDAHAAAPPAPGASAPAPGPAARAEIATSGPVEAPSIRKVGESWRLAFPFARATPAAIFVRGRTLWAVFDDASPLAVAPLVGQSGGALRSAERIALENGQVLRFALAEPGLVTAAQEGSAWIVSLGEPTIARSDPVALKPTFSADGRSAIGAELVGLGSVRKLKDPEIGDELAIATLAAPTRSLSRAQQFVEFSALATVQGLAFALLADDVRVTAAAEGLLVERDAGLTLSSAAPEPAGARALKGRPLALDAATFAEEAARPFNARQSELMGAAALASPEDRTAARLALATFLLARDRAADAKGVLDAAIEDDPSAVRDRRVPILRAAAETALDHPRATLALLGGAELAASPEAALWRAEANARLGRLGAAREELRRGEPALSQSPPALQARFVALGVELALEAGENGAAAAQFARLETLPAVHGQGERELMRARVAEALGQTDRALALYGSLIKRGEPAAVAAADLRDVELRLKAGRMEPPEAIERLERLTTGWRGDRVEAEALARLAGLYGDASRWRDAFATLRDAVEAFPDGDDTRRLQDTMQERFVDLFLGGGADKLPKLDALALFYDFKEMSPGGKRGDELVRRLADKLVEVDLLDQAYELLRYQVDNRLTGAARAQVAARAALVALMNDKAGAAIEVLRRTRQADLPGSLARARLALEARALAAAGRTDLALEMAEGLDASEARRLSADILWGARRWNEAGEALEAALGSRWRDAAPLEPAQRVDVMRAAIALSLAGDGLGVDRVRQKFAALMAQGPDASAFEVVTAPIEQRGDAFREIARSVAATASFEGFLAEYRKRADEPLAQPAPAGPGASAPAASRAS
ncbi:tetratricopeptide repeat protein [Hansschlegelia sp. KR7-227]|uniref:tetratricopeptide repeat protein n=1 Tax=Hansschlegelia sp. KR7-227 TaxID=3400914 RepID=UPI003C0EB257